MTTKKKERPADVNHNTRQKQPKGKKIHPEARGEFPRSTKNAAAAKETLDFGLRQRFAKAVERWTRENGNPAKVSALSVKLVNGGEVGSDGKIRAIVNIGRGGVNVALPAEK